VTHDAQTGAFYEAEARTYAGQAKVSPHLAAFIAELPHGASVLDLGCGGGQDSVALRDAGFDVTSIDASSAFAAEAKRLWNINVRVARFDQLDDVAAFDGIWAAASLHHAPAEALPAIFKAIQRALKPGGVLHASLKAGAADRRDKFGRFYCAMNEQMLESLLSGWSGVRFEHSLGLGYDQEAASWLRLHARAPA
jgi:SAM-dependent methyltransferase